MDADIYAFLLQCKSVSSLLTFCKNKMFEKNLVLEMSKNLKTNQNAEFCKIDYLTNNLRYEAEFLDVGIGPSKQQILVMTNSDSALSKK